MLQAGAERFRERLNDARTKDELTRLKPYRRLMQEWIEPITKGVTEWIEATKKKRGAKPVALNYVDALPPEILAYITCRTVLDRIAANRLLLISVAADIGQNIEYEAMIRAWEDSEDEGFGGLQENMTRRRSTPIHRRRVNINLFNKKGRQYVDWADWPDDHRKHLGLACVDILVRYTKQFEVRPEMVDRKFKSTKSPPMVLALKNEAIEWISDALEVAEISTPLYLPTIMPPKKWNGPRDGGYYTNIIRRPFLISFKTSQEEERGMAIADFEALSMPNVYKAVNHLQSVPWKINKRILAVAQRVFDLDIGTDKLSIPKKGKEQLPPRYADQDTNPESLKRWKKEASVVHGNNAKRISKAATARRNLNLAAQLAAEDKIYFPHMLDFRGRLYPIPVALQPQGNDLARGLLTFAEGKKISKEAGTNGWLGIQLANSWGNDKVSNEERLEWVEEYRPKWERIAADPFDDRSWMTCDNPWQALAAIFEIVDYWKHGDGFVSSLPIRVDGTCNGIQHLSAMLRDSVGGASVNLIPGDVPRDIYQEVADLVQAQIGKLDDPIAKTWMRMCNGRLPRSVTKRPVMILPYGGTRNAYTTYTLKWIKENDPHENFIPKEERFAHAKWLAHIMWDVVGGYLLRPQEVMTWIKQCARVASRGHKRALYWRTPIGFYVRHFYGKRKMMRLDTLLDGKRLQIANWKTTAELNNADVLTAISPNFVHSLDASALMSTILRVREQGVRYITTIHDSFGALAADMWTVHDALRDCFIETYKECPLTEFRTACADVARSDKDLPEVPPKGSLDLEGVRESTYFFA